MRFLPVSQNALLVELADLDATLALFDSLSRSPVDGVEEIVPAARTLLIRLRPGVNAGAVAAALLTRDLSKRDRGDPRTVEIPVLYDGADLEEAAERLGISTDELIRRHTAANYAVAFTGFAPGFAYLSAPDAGLSIPRRQTPRTRIPAGAVALAGPFSGVYPRESPGGWQIIGTTPLVMFDPTREPPTLLTPGDRVRFRRIDAMPTRAPAKAAVSPAPASPGLHVLSVALPVLVQDMGRPGLAALGVSVSGALDRGALAAANAAVGNPPDAAALEITLGGFGFEAERAMTVALAGAPAPVTLRTAEGHALAAPHGRPIRLAPGDKVSLGAPARGMRSYLAVAGGLDVPPVMHSAATDTLAGIGPEPVKAGDRLAIGPEPSAPAASELAPSQPRALPAAADIVTLDVILGPRTDWFTREAVRLLAAQEWVVTSESSRVGIRLAGATPLERSRAGELQSEGTVRGALQVPPSGQPVLFLSDHPLTGGYPVIGSISPHQLDLAGQIPIGARIRLVPTAPFAEITPTPENPS
ncbi:urea amidolyase family protein [Enterovirga sp.]|uniref:5-oxoprolinase subunit B/C family protein n=1 Tax=Enterovirga sp. TaxID=2026350 RepID=UPI002C9D1523|nr:urea amidolyase family protein [Enterovirga sp.]HMO30678.1 urea amidolyase family protein [Enterovirga sp.]